GGTLAEMLAVQPLPPPAAAGLVETLARAVHAAHLAGVVHRDLKPANVLLAGSRSPGTSGGEPTNPVIPKISDFGLAKHLDGEAPTTPTAWWLAPPAYRAAGQAGGDRSGVGPPADVYALGTILYECLTGRVPFQGPTAWDTLQQVLHEEPVPPARLARQVPRDL